MNKDNSTLGIIRRSFEYINKKIIRLLYTCLVRPHFEYTNDVLNPYKKSIWTLLKMCKKRTTKLVLGLFYMDYESRLKELSLMLPVVSLLAVPGRLFCFGSLVVLDMACCYLWLFSLYVNTKIGKVDPTC